MTRCYVQKMTVVFILTWSFNYMSTAGRLTVRDGCWCVGDDVRQAVRGGEDLHGTARRSPSTTTASRKWSASRPRWVNPPTLKHPVIIIIIILIIIIIFVFFRKISDVYSQHILAGREMSYKAVYQCIDMYTWSTNDNIYLGCKVVTFL